MGGIDRGMDASGLRKDRYIIAIDVSGGGFSSHGPPIRRRPLCAGVCAGFVGEGIAGDGLNGKSGDRGGCGN